MTTWAMPPEPGPEVTTVRSSHGTLWRRRPGKGTWMKDGGLKMSWDTLVFTGGPLTDETPKPITNG